MKLIFIGDSIINSYISRETVDANGLNSNSTFNYYRFIWNEYYETNEYEYHGNEQRRKFRKEFGLKNFSCVSKRVIHSVFVYKYVWSELERYKSPLY